MSRSRPALTVGSFVRLLWQWSSGTLMRLGGLSAVVVLSEIGGLALLAPLLASFGAPGAGSSRLIGLLAHVGLVRGFDDLLLAYVGVGLLFAAASTRAVTYQVRLGQEAVGYLRARLCKVLMRASWAAVVEVRTTEVIHAATVAQTHVLYATQQFGVLLSAIGAIGFYAVACLALAPATTLLVALVGALYVLLARRRRQRLLQWHRSAHDASAAYQAVLQDTLQGLRHVRAHGLEADALALLATADAEHGRHRWRATVDTERGRAGQLAAGTLALAGILALAVHRLAVPSLDVLVLVFMLLRLWPRLGQLQRTLTQVSQSLPFIDHLLELDARLGTSAPPPVPARAVAPPRRCIALRGVSFAYRKPDPSVSVSDSPELHNFSLELPIGTVTALVGPSGAGKSTCVDLLAGLLPPDAGALWLDDEPLDAAGRPGWRAQVTSITADALLIHASVRDNLLFGLHPKPADATLWQALDLAAADFVRDLPQTLDTPISDRGARLSGGQRQRLALARAWLRPASLLILDEATGALDAATEARVFYNLRHHPPASTIVIISHRDSVRTLADRVVEMPLSVPRPASPVSC